MPSDRVPELTAKFALLVPNLDERQRRLLLVSRRWRLAAVASRWLPGRLVCRDRR